MRFRKLLKQVHSGEVTSHWTADGMAFANDIYGAGVEKKKPALGGLDGLD